MGRHRREVSETDSEKQAIIEERLGIKSYICQNCNARNSKRADKCRKCGYTELRRKAREYRDS